MCAYLSNSLAAYQHFEKILLIEEILKSNNKSFLRRLIPKEKLK